MDQGLNRVSWDQQWQGKAIYGPLMSPDLERPLAPPGRYRVTVQALDEEAALGTAAVAELNLQPDPRVSYSAEVFDENHRFRLRLEELQALVDDATETLSCMEETLQSDVVEPGPAVTGLRRDLTELWTLLDFRDIQGTVSDSPRLRHQLSKAFYFTHSPYTPLSENDEQFLKSLERQANSLLKRMESLIDGSWQSVYSSVEEQDEGACYAENSRLSPVSD